MRPPLREGERLCRRGRPVLSPSTTSLGKRCPGDGPTFPFFIPKISQKIFYKILILHLSYLLLTWYNYQVSILEGMEAEFGLTNIHNLYTFQNLIVVLYVCTECPNMG